MIYLLIYLWILSISVAEVNNFGSERKIYTFLFWITGFLLVFVSGTRDSIGYDYFQYKDLYSKLEISNYTSHAIEVGFAAIVQVFRYSGISFNGFLVTVSMVTILAKLKYFKDNSFYIFPALLSYYTIGFPINEMGQIRHGIAIAIGLYAFNDLLENKAKAYFIKVFCGFLIHASTLVLIPVWFLAKWKKLTPSNMIVLIIVFLPFIFIDIRRGMYSILGYIPFYQIQAKSLFYIYSNEFGQNLGLNISFLLRIIVFVCMILLTEKGEKLIPGFDKLIRIYFFGIVLYEVFSSIAEFAIRSSAYFKALDSILFPFFIYCGKRKLDKNVILLIFALYSLYSLYKVVYSQEIESPFLPYKSVLENIFISE